MKRAVSAQVMGHLCATGQHSSLGADMNLPSILVRSTHKPSEDSGDMNLVNLQRQLSRKRPSRPAIWREACHRIFGCTGKQIVESTPPPPFAPFAQKARHFVKDPSPNPSDIRRTFGKIRIHGQKTKGECIESIIAPRISYPRELQYHEAPNETRWRVAGVPNAEV